MRKIEQAMNTAIANSTNWTSGNTTVHFNEEENISLFVFTATKLQKSVMTSSAYLMAVAD